MKEFKYTINGNQYTVEVVKEEGAEVELTVNGTPYTVQVEQKEVEEAPKTARPAAPAAGGPVIAKKSAAGGAIKAPLPGVILDVCVKVGDVVKAGDKVLLLEAMKMENTVNSDQAGTVLEIKVAPGQTVLEGTDLIIVG